MAAPPNPIAPDEETAATPTGRTELVWADTPVAISWRGSTVSINVREHTVAEVSFDGSKSKSEEQVRLSGRFSLDGTDHGVCVVLSPHPRQADVALEDALVVRYRVSIDASTIAQGDLVRKRTITQSLVRFLGWLLAGILALALFRYVTSYPDHVRWFVETVLSLLIRLRNFPATS